MIYTNEMIRHKLMKKERLNKIFRIITLPITIITIITVLYIGYIKFIKQEDDINLFGIRFYMVLTGSMEPNYNIGDVIVVKETSKDNIKVGDVINFLSENGNDTVTHRVTEIIENDGATLFKTKGDNTNSEDSEAIEFSRVQGTLLFKISKMGIILTKLFTGTGLCIAILVIIFSYLRESRQEEKRIAREEARRIYNIPKYEKEDVV